jgi:hypothetical protein
MSNFKLNPLTAIVATAIAMMVAIFTLGYLKGGSLGISVALVELVYVVFVGTYLVSLKRRFGNVPAVIASTSFWGWLTITVICFIWAAVQYIV